MLRKKRPLIGAVLVLQVGLVACSNPSPAMAEGEFQKFWTEFRRAALKKDVDRVSSMTAFPFETKGSLDENPIRSHDAGAFRAIFSKLLDMDTGLSAKRESMLQYIERKPTVASTGDQTRVGQFVFEKRQGKWAFVMAYLEE
jgi:hypothetical protein